MSNSQPLNSTQKSFQLTDKVAIVTGASKGIGAAIVQGFAELGAKVVVSSRKQAAVDEVAQRLKSEGYEATGIACHVGDEEQITQLVKQTIDTYGRIDIIVNNAATNPSFGPISEENGALFDKVMGVNVKGPFELCRQAYPYLKDGGGSVINISSVEGLKPSFGLGLYSVSKAALIMLSQSLAKEWGKDGIRVNTICPGLIQTKFSAALWQNEQILKQFTEHLPTGRMATPEEMVGIAVFLASDAASYCTGGVYTADGGHMIM